LFLPRQTPISTLFPYTTLFRSFSRHALCICQLLLALPVCKHASRRLFRARVHWRQRNQVTKSEPATWWKYYCPSVSCIRLAVTIDRKSTRLNSSHVKISYAVFC